MSGLLNFQTSQLLNGLNVRLGLGKADNLAVFLPLTSLLEQFDAFEALQNVALSSDGAGAFEAAMLRHKKPSWVE